MIRDMRDIAILIFMVYILSIMTWVLLSPEDVGQWKARINVSYDSIWSEYIFDRDYVGSFE